MAINVTIQDADSGVDVTVAGGANRTDEEIEDVVASLVTGGSNITVSYDDGNDTLTIDTSALDTEEVEDAVNALLSAGDGISLNYDDGADTLTVAVDESALSFYDGTNLTADVDNSSVTTEEATINQSATYPSGEQTTTHPSLVDWEEDDNSPLEISNASSGTITLASEYDMVQYIFTSGSTNNNISLRIDGDTSTNYFYVEVSGTRQTSQSEVGPIVKPSSCQGSTGLVTGKWDGNAGGFNFPMWSTISTAVNWENTNVSSPLDSLTFFNTSGDNFSATIEVWGR